MVEGPGCRLKGEKMASRIKGQKVKAVNGNAVEKRTKAEREAGSPYDVLIGMKLTDVKTLGKELFAIFENDACLRVHFLMAGSVRYNNEPREFGDGKSETPRLQLFLSKDEVGFYNSAVEMRSATECLARYDELINLDICSPTFDAKRATDAILEHQERLICDVILDQLVLPGVGNIIKNEALFNAGINPNSKVKQLNKELVAFLVKMNRDFSMIFYKCRKEGKDLRKHMNIYGKGKCTECSGKVTKCKPGEYERVTYFCPKCQTNTLQTKKNSLLGWVTWKKDLTPWNCIVCTLENKPANNKCLACLTPRHSEQVKDRECQVQVELTEGPLEDPEDSESNLQLSPNTQDASSTQLKHGQKRTLQASQDAETNSQRRYKFRRLSTSPGLPSTSSQETSLTSLDTVVSQRRLQETPAFRDPKERELAEQPILCSGHKVPARKLRAEKNAENRGRIFYVCNLSKQKQCNFFTWGDEHHPLCGHGKVTVIRSVLKQNANNGREFYCCPLPKTRQCDFFQWADGR